MAGNGLLRFKGCVSIPKDHTIREEVGKFREPTTSDFITDLLPSRRRNQVDDVILMQIRHLYSLPEGYRRPCAGELLFGRVASIFDMLKNMISVRGSIFTSKLWSSLCYYNSPGVKCRLSTAFR